MDVACIGSSTCQKQKMVHKLYSEVLKTVSSSQAPINAVTNKDSLDDNVKLDDFESEPQVAEMAGSMRRRVDDAEEVMKS